MGYFTQTLALKYISYFLKAQFMTFSQAWVTPSCCNIFIHYHTEEAAVLTLLLGYGMCLWKMWIFIALVVWTSTIGLSWPPGLMNTVLRNYSYYLFSSAIIIIIIIWLSNSQLSLPFSFSAEVPHCQSENKNAKSIDPFHRLIINIPL